MTTTLTASPAWDLLDLPPYGLAQPEKTAALVPRLRALTAHHYAHCEPYRHIVDRVFGGAEAALSGGIEDQPFIPVSLFKSYVFKSVPDEVVTKVLTSSGTTGQQVSRIFVDGETARAQSAVLVKVAQHFLGKQRLPMIILDHAGVLKDRRSFSARGAGILGMSQFGHKPFYALREDMSLDVDGLTAYVAGAAGKRILLFGFTYMVWASFVQALERSGLEIDLSNGILIHSGGWKKLIDIAVDASTFRTRLQQLTKLPSVVNFYGMVEQVGGVYFENPIHHLHAPIYSDVIIRDPVTLKPLPDGEVGLIQVLSCLPVSYPGHSLLTEDLGVIRGCDVPGLEMKGRCFDVIGRVAKSELRGCSDTFQAPRGEGSS
jgi:hypothetical protein